MALIVAEEPLENPITQVEIDTHRWYSIITVTYMSDAKFVRVIAKTEDGLNEFDSYEEYEKWTAW